jgi:hypothetical protein
MNVKDPLWPATTSESSNTISPSSKDSAASNAQSLITGVTAVIHAAPTPTTPDTVTSSATNLVEAFIEALDRQPGSHLFEFREFWYIAVSVTAATIFLPLFVGAVFRTIVRFSYNQREIWKTAVFLLALGVSLMLSCLWSGAARVLGIPQAILVSSVLCRKMIQSRRPKRIQRWLVYASVLVACMLFDLWDHYLSSWSVPDVISDALYPNLDPLPSLTGIVGTWWLVGLWIWKDRPLLALPELDQLDAKKPRAWTLVRRILHATASVVKALKSKDPARQGKRTLLFSLFFLLATSISIFLSLFLPVSLYVGLTYTYFGLYGLFKLRETVPTHRGCAWCEDARVWGLFILVSQGGNLFWWYTYAGTYIGAPVLFPMAALAVIHSETVILAAGRRWFWRFQSAPHRIRDARGQQRAQDLQVV